jgi:hypothetical protein
VRGTSRSRPPSADWYPPLNDRKMTGRQIARAAVFLLGRGAAVRDLCETVAGAGDQGPRMDTHKFRIGQSVRYRSRPGDAPQGLYVIIALLPRRQDGEFEYRIKHSHEHDQRSAKESELRPPTASHGL